MVDDPVLTATGTSPANVKPVLCAATGPGRTTGKRDLADAGLRAEVAGLERRQGYLMARLTVTNPTGQAIALAPGSGLTPEQADPNGLSLADRTDQLRQLPCHTSARAVGFYYLANPTSDYSLEGGASVPAGATVTFYAFYPRPRPG